MWEMVFGLLCIVGAVSFCCLIDYLFKSPMPFNRRYGYMMRKDELEGTITEQENAPVES